MAHDSFKVNKSLNLNPQASVPGNPVDGDIYFDSTAASLVYYNRGAWACLESITPVASATSMTSALFTPAIVKNSIVRLTGTGGNLYGLAASFAGKKVTLYNNCSGSVSIRYNSSTEPTANNRILTPSSGDMTLVAGEIAQLMYDTTQNRWLLVSVGSGAGAYAPATTTTNGTVKLNAAPVASNAPAVAVVNGSGRVVAAGINNDANLGSAADIVIGGGTKDKDVIVNGKIKPTSGTKSILMLPHSFSAHDATLFGGAYEYDEGFWEDTVSGAELFGRCHLPEGSTPTSLKACFWNAASTNQIATVCLSLATPTADGYVKTVKVNWALTVPSGMSTFAWYSYTVETPLAVPESDAGTTAGAYFAKIQMPGGSPSAPLRFDGLQIFYTYGRILPVS